MDKPVALDRVDMSYLAQKCGAEAVQANLDTPAILVRHATLVAEYTAHMAAAGYSTAPSDTGRRSLGAWSFLNRFPEPEEWLKLPVADQRRLPLRERNFVHYLFLRHLLPLPPSYALTAHAHLGDMARRLMEKETYERYKIAALRLGYTEPTIHRQFQSLLCLMAWAGKSLDALSAQDMDAFIQAMKAAYQEVKNDGDLHVMAESGLPRSWNQELSGLGKVLSHLRILPPTTRTLGKREKPAQPTPYQRLRAMQQDTSSPQACLVAQYTSYTAAAGFSTNPSTMMERTLGAWYFLSRFPQPEAWLDLPLEKQVRLRHEERLFLHYLFLRHLLPMPAPYILVAGHNLATLARPLMERAIYERYFKEARRLRYTESTIRRQFEALLCVMAWCQKPVSALTTLDLDIFTDALIAARRELEARGGVISPQDIPLGQRLPWTVLKANQDGLPHYWSGRLGAVRQVLYHLGVLHRPWSRRPNGQTFLERWQTIPDHISYTVQRYLGQLAISLRTTSLAQEEGRLRCFFSWLAQNMPEITEVNQLQRRHIEAFKEHLHRAPPRSHYYRPPGSVLRPGTIRGVLSTLRNFFSRLAEWDWPESPGRPLIFNGDFPRRDMPLPRFLEEPDAARFLQAARDHSDLFTRVCGVTLLFTGLRKSDFLNLTRDCIISIGQGSWLKVPLGKLHKERLVPLHPEVKQLLQEWISHQCPDDIPLQLGDFLFTYRGRRVSSNRVDVAVQRISAAGGITGRVTPHRLRHTLATLALNHGMSLSAVADLLGHKSMSMTRVYARLNNRTLRNQYSTVSGQLEKLCGLPSFSPLQAQEKACSTLEGEKSISQGPRRLEAHWRTLGNGYCTRPQEVPCEYEYICEACPGFYTTAEFLPQLLRQKEDAEDKGYSRMVGILDKLIHKLEIKH